MCPFCEKEGTRTCYECRKETFLDGLSVFASYANPVVREAILQWKYVGDRVIEPVIESWLVRSAPRLAPQRRDAIFAPVPLHKYKHFARGFDQAGILSDWCGQLFSRPVFDLLMRTRMTAPQARQQKNKRKLGQLDNAFMIDPHVQDIPKSVVLCDDVFTSGATMDAAAKCLKQTGVEWVWGFVLAKGNP
jgi:ComF family protein